MAHLYSIKASLWLFTDPDSFVHYSLTYTTSMSITQDKPSCYLSTICKYSQFVAIRLNPTGNSREPIADILVAIQQQLTRTIRTLQEPIDDGTSIGVVKGTICIVHLNPHLTQHRGLNSIPKRWVSILDPKKTLILSFNFYFACWLKITFTILFFYIIELQYNIK